MFKALKEQWQSRQKRWNLRWMSMRTKWLIMTTTFLLIIFSGFALLVYQNSISILSSEGQTTVSRIVSHLEAALSESRRLQQGKDVENALKNAILEQYSSKSSDDDDVDTLLSELGEEHLYVYIYNLQKKKIYETRSGKNYQQTPIVQSMHIIDQGNMTGFIVGKPIKSKKTHQTIGYIQIFYELKELYSIRNKLLIVVILFIFIAFFLSLFCSIIISSYFLKPIKEVIHTMKKIQEDPISAERTVLPRKRDELWELTQISNTMIDQIQLYIEQQGRFVQDASHELRTPVAVLEGHLNMLHRWGKDDAEVLDESLEAALQEVKRMKTLIQEMLDLTRVDEIELKHISEHTDVLSAIRQIINNFQMLYPEFTFRYQSNIQTLSYVQIQRTHLEQLLVIFLDNAVKYSEDRKEVDVTTSIVDGKICIKIKDYGEGISKEDLPLIFDRFYRVDKARSREKGGNGLGLSIAKKLIDGYNGVLDVESQLHKGTTFFIYLPLVVIDEE